MTVRSQDESRQLAEQVTTLRPEDREFLIAKLAEILVLDYQQNQSVVEAADEPIAVGTVKTPTLLNRRRAGG